MCTTAYCICVAIVGTMCLVITDNVNLMLNLYKLLLNPLTAIWGYLDPYFNRLSSNGYNLHLLWVINLGSKLFSYTLNCVQIHIKLSYSITIETLRNTSYVIASLTILT